MKIKQSKLLVPGYLTNQIYPFLLEKQKQNATFGIKVDNVYTLMDDGDYKKESKEAIIYRVHEILKGNKDSFKVFGGVLENINFINQFIEFYTECIYYEIDINDLPEETDEEKETKKIIGLIDSLNLGIRENYNNLLDNVNNHEVLDKFYSTFIEYKLLQKAKEKASKSFENEELFYKEPNYIFKKATTRGKELEDIAKYIIDKNESSIQVVVSDNNYYEDVARVFSSYDIPYRRATYKYDSVLVKRLLDFVDFLIKKDLDSLLVVLRKLPGYKVIGDDKKPKLDEDNKEIIVEYDELCDYAKHFKLQLDEFEKPFNRFSDVKYDKILELRKKLDSDIEDVEKEKTKKEIEKIINEYKLFDIISFEKCEELIKLEAKAETRRKHLQETINKWINDDPYESLMKFYNDITRKVDWQENQSDYSAFSSAGRLIVESQKHNGDLKILYELLKNVKKSDDKSDSMVVLVTDMNHLYINKDITIVVGANEGTFLPTLEKSEIIKEDYVSKIDNYPSLEERLKFNDLKMECLKNISPEIVISYCYSDYSGKEHKLSNYIEKTFKKTEKDFIEKDINDQDNYNYYKKTDKTLSKANVKELFVKEGNGISGSVSSLEQYQSCPYSYFLQRGLGISDMEGYQSVDAAILGNLRHKIFEILGKNGFSDPKQLDELFDDYQKAIDKIFSNETDESSIRRKMIGDALKLNEIIAVKIKEDGFENVAQEFKLNNVQVNVGDYHFNFNAIVDRIDQKEEHFYVVDYKSSDHKLSLTEFDKGKQLQLLTYLWLLWREKVYDKKPGGAYYFDLNINNKYDLIKAIEAIDDDKLLEAFIAKNKLQGLTIKELIGYKRTGTPDYKELKSNYVSNASDRRDQERRDKYDIKLIECLDKFLSELYTEIANNIISGKMESRPDAKTCQYCVFSSICHKEEFETTDEELEETENE